ncbi:PIG-L deacetylase family protein [Mycolicibacterium iranicum]|uniref:PIG-L family deacetylase n=1 Tax=Mycolicibacterium iranicum TaxID=912594 RepID=A0ABT4HB20_MYCIR|nr:PIG-L family deacetylase [Mycolicibacterium iranicum]MCZ0727374.1 PIG-L family deacetylase [Mycolicibacterium iranicum]
MTISHISNSERMAQHPLAGGGTPADVWSGAGLQFPPLDLTGCQELVVVGAHPDDETLGFGAAAGLLAASGVRVQIVSASDGGAAFPEYSLLQRYQLERTRRAELQRAACVLGLPPPISLGLPDGDIALHEQRLTDLLIEILVTKPPGTWCAATWRGDGHPDHEAVGRAAATATAYSGATLIEYPVWMWHWAQPDDIAVPWDRTFAAPSTPAAAERKKLAAQCFESQFVPQSPEGQPVLPAYLLPRLLTVGEVVFC